MSCPPTTCRLARYLLTCLALVAATVRGAEPARPTNPRLTGTPLMQVWQAEDYGAAPINWRVMQHPTTGLIYVGNNFGVLEFDGAFWRTIPMPKEGSVRALAVDRHGAIWAAGTSDIARLEPDATGTLDAVDMTARLPTNERAFGLLNRCVPTADGVYFAGDRRIFLFRDDGSIRVWRTEGIFSPLWLADGAVYVARDRQELLRLQSDGGAKVVFTTNNPEDPLMRTYSAVREGDAWVLLTRYGPVRWGGEGTATTPFSPEHERMFAADPARAMFQLANGNYVFGSIRGALILDRTGKIERRLDVTHGLPVDTVNGFAEDREGGLWIAMQNGLARVQLASPFALHHKPQNLDAGPRRLARFNDRLYVAHGSGVSWRDPVSGEFRDVAGVRSGGSRPVVVRERLLVTSGLGLREILPNDTSVTVSPMTFIPLVESKRQPGWLLGGDNDGVSLFSYPGPNAARPGWKLEGRLKNLPTGVVQLYDSGDGFAWAVSDSGGIWRIDFRRGLSLEAPCEQFDAERGVPPARRRDHVQLFFLGRELFAGSTAWLLRYDPQRERFAPAPAGLDFASSADAIESSSHDTVWLHANQPESEILRLTASAAGGPPAVQRFPATPLQGMILNALFHEPETSTLWISGQGVLVSMDVDWKPEAPPPAPVAVVRRVTTGAGTLLFGGDASRRPRVLALASSQNALRVEFAAPTFASNYLGTIRTQYRTRVDGLETDWTRWSAESFRDFTNLPYRDLVVHVQAQAADGRISEDATLALSIASPWWLTRWAFALYLVGAYAGIFGFITLRTRALRQRAAELEDIIARRTAELAEKNQTLATQNVELTRLRLIEAEEKIAARFAEEKARLEVLRYQLNPHFLFNAFTSICAQLPPALNGARATIERLTDFCRLTLFRPANGENPTLAEEMRMVSAYLDIEKTRWGHLLEVDLAIDRAVEGERIPALLLLPLIENALKYGGATSPGGLKVRIAARRDDDGLTIEVANTGTWVSPSSHGRGDVPSLGIGHENLRQRLQRHYPGAHTFTTEARDGWVTVRVTLRAPDAGARAAAGVATTGGAHD